jgi:hypothetical protein
MRNRQHVLLLVSCSLLVSLGSPMVLARGNGPATLAPGARVWMHAHNCYPVDGAWEDRIDRALGTGLPWVAIEQDVAWIAPAAGLPGRSVVAHDTPAEGDEPTLESHFFERVRPLLDRALAEDHRDRWPIVVMSLDFKTNEPEHHRAVWDLLGRYERYLTIATKRGHAGSVSPLRAGPLLVLTESGEGQERDFFTSQPYGATLRLFGTVPPPELDKETEKRRHELGLDRLVPSGATDYRRWVNFPWSAVEAGGPPEAGAWSDADDARLRALVTRAHSLGLWIRFYTLNGHAPAENRGWSDSYNFGSIEAARQRWEAVRRAHVDFVATDQYEALADAWKRARQPGADMPAISSR